MSVVLFSGGMDSTALLATRVATGEDVLAVSVNYGQRHQKEIEAAQTVCEHFGVSQVVVDLSSLSESLRSALTGNGEVPDGHYAEDTMRQTVVPNRNAIMLMVAAGIASSHDMNTVYTAVHAGDHYIYPDCRPEFITSASLTASLGTAGFGDVEIFAPFVNLSKADIASIGAQYEAPFRLTWSCYKGEGVHCGACGTCFERREAFTLAGVTDPTVYKATPHYEAPEGL